MAGLMATLRVSIIATLLAGISVGAGAQTAAGLRIIVIEGEDAVNVVQQKTAVAPVVEVRDRNDQPVAGAVVRFAVTKGRATFSGARTLTVTTNAAGRAAVTSLTPTGSGALQIGATATFQGQAATAVTIAQTNVMTAAQAAGATGAAGAGGGGSGGMSAGTITAVTAGAAGGAIVAAKELSGDPAPVTRTYSGSFSGPFNLIFTQNSGAPGCARTHQYSGTVQATLTVDGETVTGTLVVQAQSTVTAVTCTGGPQLGAAQNGQYGPSNVTGTKASVGGEVVGASSGPDPTFGGTTSTTRRFMLVGSLSNDTITGTLTQSETIVSPVDRGIGTATFPVTLR